MYVCMCIYVCVCVSVNTYITAKKILMIDILSLQAGALVVFGVFVGLLSLCVIVLSWAQIEH